MWVQSVDVNTYDDIRDQDGVYNAPGISDRLLEYYCLLFCSLTFSAVRIHNCFSPSWNWELRPYSPPTLNLSNWGVASASHQVLSSPWTMPLLQFENF